MGMVSWKLGLELGEFSLCLSSSAKVNEDWRRVRCMIELPDSQGFDLRIGAGNLPIPSAVLADYDTEIVLDIFLKLGSNNCSAESFEGLHYISSVIESVSSDHLR